MPIDYFLNMIKDESSSASYFAKRTIESYLKMEQQLHSFPSGKNTLI